MHWVHQTITVFFFQKRECNLITSQLNDFKILRQTCFSPTGSIFACVLLNIIYENRAMWSGQCVCAVNRYSRTYRSSHQTQSVYGFVNKRVRDCEPPSLPPTPSLINVWQTELVGIIYGWSSWNHSIHPLKAAAGGAKGTLEVREAATLDTTSTHTPSSSGCAVTSRWQLHWFQNRVTRP